MPNFDYTSRDYAAIKESLLLRASQSLPEWTDRDPSDFMMALIDLWAYAADVLHFYVDRAAGESFLPTATQRESVLSLANLYDYVPNFLSSSTATVYVANSAAASVSIPAYTAMTATVSGLRYNFYTPEAVYVPASSSTSFRIRQGTRYEDQAVINTAGGTVSAGTASQRFSVFHKQVDPSTLLVDVYEGAGGSAVRWTQVSRMVNQTSGDAVYYVYVAADGTTQIVFGNGITGRVPPTNVEVKASYAVSNGSAGNLPANSVTSFSSGSFTGLSVSSSSATVGGSDPESIASMKAGIPRVFRTLDRAVTLSDYADMAIGVQGVTKAATSYATSGGTGGSVTVYATPYVPDYLVVGSTIAVEQTVRDAVYEQVMGVSMLGVSHVAVPATIELTAIYTNIALNVKDNYVATWVQSDVATAVDSLFEFDAVSFGQVLTLGDVYRTILAVPGVDYVQITAFSNTIPQVPPIATDILRTITINPYKLARKGVVVFDAVVGGVAAPS